MLSPIIKLGKKYCFLQKQFSLIGKRSTLNAKQYLHKQNIGRTHLTVGLLDNDDDENLKNMKKTSNLS